MINVGSLRALLYRTLLLYSNKYTYLLIKHNQCLIGRRCILYIPLSYQRYLLADLDITTILM